MYPEIRLIGHVEKVEDNHPNPFERTLSLRVPFRNGSHGAFRVRVPRGEEHAFSAGDEVFVSGELDELGAIHPHRFGAIRKLAPMLAQPNPPTGRNDTWKPTDATGQDRPDTPALIGQPDQGQAVEQNPSPTKPASSPAPRPAPTFAKAGSLFGNRRTAPRPSPSPAPALAAPAGTKPGGTAPSPAAAAPRSFAGVRQGTSRSETRPTLPSSPGTTPVRSNGHAWDIDDTPRPGPPAKPQSNLAEYLQDEIPW